MNVHTSFLLHILYTKISQIPSQKFKNLLDKLTGAQDINWSRVIMRQSYRQIINSVQPNKLKVLEISGNYFATFEFKEYQSIFFPEYDVCADPIPDEFDLIIAEQVFEHLLWPYRAAKNIYQMLKIGGYFLISTPFLVRVHGGGVDCTRWTELGLKHFLAESGFSFEKIQTYSWGNRACIQANLTHDKWVKYHSKIHSLTNEPDFPVAIWALAQK